MPSQIPRILFFGMLNKPEHACSTPFVVDVIFYKVLMDGGENVKGNF